MESKSLYKDLLSNCLSELNQINQNAYHAFKTAWIATINKENSFASLRTVVIRSFNEINLFEIYTDTRSQKWQDLKVQPIAELGFYHPDKKIQLRIKAKTTLISDGEYANEKITQLNPEQLKNYSTAAAPGSLLSSNQAQNINKSATIHFGIIQAEIFEIDYLQLLPKNDSLRALISWDADVCDFNIAPIVP
jgi:hypothetical protein